MRSRASTPLDVDVAHGAAAVAHEVVVVGDVRVEPCAPVPSSSTVQLAHRDEVGRASGRRCAARCRASRSTPRAYSASAVGWRSLPCSSRNSSWRCGVTFSPCAPEGVGELGRSAHAPDRTGSDRSLQLVQIRMHCDERGASAEPREAGVPRMRRCRPTSPSTAPTCSRRLEAETFDVLVIGGGITGVGVALDAASRGLRTALVERDDFASGTSSKSSKLVHGGLRYLQQGEVRLVYEALHERQRLRRNAPHLVQRAAVHDPDPHQGRRRVAQDRPGARLGDVDVRPHRRLADRQAAPPAEGRRRVRPPADDAPRAAGLAPTCTTTPPPTTPGSCLTVARTAAAHGAVVANRCARRRRSTKDADGRGRRRRWSRPTAGAITRPRPRRSSTPPACGPTTSARSTRAPHPDSIRPAKGVHITVPWDKVRNDIAVVIPVPKDKRSLFVVPWGPRADGTFEHTYIGTTDTDYDGPLDDPQCTADDIDYVLRALNASVTTGDHRRRHHRRVGRAAAAGRRRPTVGPHRRPVAPPQRRRRAPAA